MDYVPSNDNRYRHNIYRIINMDDYNKQYYQIHKEELKKKRRDRYYKTSERLKYKKTRTKIVKNYIEEK